MRLRTAARSSWSVEQRCTELLDALAVAPPFDEAAFLSGVGRLAGGTVTVARLDHATWTGLQASLRGHVSGITTPYPGGWAILLPETSAATETTVLGHEAAHVLFGDVPHWDACPPDVRMSALLGFDADADSPTLPPVVRRLHLDSRREVRAERLGALLTARVELADDERGPTDRVDHFFRVGEV